MKTTALPILPLLCALMPAQTYVVAAAGGGNFTDLPQAVAAVPSGATLHVKPGNYTGFTVQAKSLTILAETLGTARIQINPLNRTLVTAIGPSDQVCISGLAIDGGFILSNSAGNVSLDPFTTGGYVNVDHCSSAHITSCTMSSGTIVCTASNLELTDSTVVGMDNFFWPATPALQATVGSSVTIIGSVLIGGDASYQRFAGGRPGVYSMSSTIHVLGEGPGAASTPTLLQGGPGATGGDGFDLLFGSNARIFGATLVGGRGAPPGQPLAVTSSTVSQYAVPGPSAYLTGLVGPGQTVVANLRGAPSSPALLLLGDRGCFVQPPILALGASTVIPVLVVDSLTVPANGLLQVPITMPLGWPRDTVVFGQFLMLDQALNEIQASNTFTLITR